MIGDCGIIGRLISPVNAFRLSPLNYNVHKKGSATSESDLYKPQSTHMICIIYTSQFNSLGVYLLVLSQWSTTKKN